MAEVPEKKERYRLLAVIEGKTMSRSLDRDLENEDAYTYPHLVYRELIVAVVVFAALCILSIVFNAPLDAEASSTNIPNPAKAPWYFVGLQETLVYFDPWIAGIIVPTLIVFGLMAIPYISSRRKHMKYYSLSGYGRKVVAFGFILWSVLIIIGQLCRGAYWQWTWFGGHLIPAKPTVNLPNILGFAIIFIYSFLWITLPFAIMKLRRADILKKYGIIKYAFATLFSILLFFVPFKIFIRLAFSVKYIITTPWFNI